MERERREIRNGEKRNGESSDRASCSNSIVNSDTRYDFRPCVYIPKGTIIMRECAARRD